MDKSPLHLFEAYGIELEYMLVEKETLNVLPIADQLIFKLAGSYEDDVDLGEIGLSNELVSHVIELKTNGPKQHLNTLSSDFHRQIVHLNEILSDHAACLLPSGAHPWMNPDTEMKLWPHGYNEVYSAFDRIFNCRGHGWANLQSTHLNLPFCGDEEFGRLHSAIRLILPILPGLSASTPLIDGAPSGAIDSRLTFYGKNQEKIPSISGNIIPEIVLNRGEYEDKILNPMYRDIAIHDPGCILQFEWLNSRGAIARFDRNAIEIRVLDIQESPKIDLAIIEFIVGVLKLCVAEKFTSLSEQHQETEHELLVIFKDVVQQGLNTVIRHPHYLTHFGIKAKTLSLREVWQELLQTTHSHGLISEGNKRCLEVLLREGNLSERILKHLNGDFKKEKIKGTYHQLQICLEKNEFFTP